MVLYTIYFYFYNKCILQLCMMVIAVGLSSYNVALFHLINHAYLFIECIKNLTICWGISLFKKQSAGKFIITTQRPYVKDICNNIKIWSQYKI